MKKAFFRKIKKTAGFTLMEMIVAIAILVLISTAMTSGLAVATRSYRDSVFHSDSEVLCDTLNTALSDVLRYAVFTGSAPDGTLLFANDQYNILSGGHFVNQDGRVYIDTGGDMSEQVLVINTGSYVGLQVTGFILRYDAAVNTYSGEYVIGTQDGTMTKNCTFVYRSLR